jgi:hypothetical protein
MNHETDVSHAFKDGVNATLIDDPKNEVARFFNEVNCKFCGAETQEKPKMTTTTDTPRTDAARFEALRSSAFRQDCIPLKLGQELERELKASKAEVALLQKELDATCNAEELRQERETRKRAEAEVDFYKKSVKAYVHVCEPIRGMADKLGLRLGECIIQHGVPLLLEGHKKAEAEVERLRSQLARSIEIAETACKYLDTGGWNEDEMYSGKDGWVTETEIDEVCATLAALKSEIK